MATVALPAVLAELFPGCGRREAVDGATVGELLEALDTRWPGFRDRVVEGRGAVARPRRHIRLFVDGSPGGLESPVAAGSLVQVLLAISGGSGADRASGPGGALRFPEVVGRTLLGVERRLPGELPADRKTWLRQQQRWQDGFRHVGLRMVWPILRSRDITLSAKLAALLHLCMALNQPVLLIGIVSGVLAGVLAPALKPVLWLVFFATLAWVLFCATTFLRAGHNFIRDGEMPPGRFAVVLLRFVAGQLAMLLRSLMVHVGKALSRPKPIVFDRTPKKGS